MADKNLLNNSEEKVSSNKNRFVGKTTADKRRIITDVERQEMRYKGVRKKARKTNPKQTDIAEKEKSIYESEAVDVEERINKKSKSVTRRTKEYIYSKGKKAVQNTREQRKAENTKVSANAKKAAEEQTKNEAKKKAAKQATSQAATKAAAKKAATTGGTAVVAASSVTPAAPVALAIGAVNLGKKAVKKVFSLVKESFNGEDATLNNFNLAFFACGILPVLLLFVLIPMLISGGKVDDAGKIYEDQVGNYICPIPTEYDHGITRGFGVPTGGIGTTATHLGTDIYSTNKGTGRGTRVIAVCDGTIYAASSGCIHDFPKDYNCGCNGGYGKYVLLSADNGLDFYYAHLSGVIVKAGQKVKQGQVLGYMGCTGYSTGVHLHFEVRNTRIQGNRAAQNIDPVTVLEMQILLPHKTIEETTDDTAKEDD